MLTSKEQVELEPKGTWDPSGCAGRARRDSSCARRWPPSRSCLSRSRRSARKRWCPSRICCGRTSGSGIATDAFDRARAFVRASAKRAPGEPVPAATRLVTSHDAAVAAPRRSRSALQEFQTADATPNRERLATMASALRFNNLKIASSEQAPRVCQGAMNVCGIVGFLNDTPYSVGRHLATRCLAR